MPNFIFPFSELVFWNSGYADSKDKDAIHVLFIDRGTTTKEGFIHLLPMLHLWQSHMFDLQLQIVSKATVGKWIRWQKMQVNKMHFT